MFIICSHIRFLVKRERFHFVLFICLFFSQCSLFFSLSLFGSVFYFQVFEKIKISVSGLEKNHNSRFCFLSRSTSFLFKRVLVHIAQSLLLLPTAVRAALRVRGVFRGDVSSPWLAVLVAHSRLTLPPRRVPRRHPNSASTLSPLHLLPPPSVYPNLPHSHLLFNQIGARPVELSNPPSLVPLTLFLSCVEPPG